MAAKFTTQGDATYLEERILANADQATATSDSSASSELRAYVTSDPFPTTFPQNTLRCWREPGETQWKLYKCTVANSAHWNFEENLPAGRP